MRAIEKQYALMLAATIGSLLIFFIYFTMHLSARTVPPWPAGDGAPGGAHEPGHPQGRFVDVTEQWGIQFVHQAGTQLYDISQITGSGVAIGDVNGDGLLDVYLVNGAGDIGRWVLPRNALFLNRGGGHFERVPGAGGAAGGGQGMGAVMVDYDRDGDLDVYVTNLGPNALYRNDGSGHFEDVALAAGVADPRWSTGAAFADYDGDGNVDLYVANYLEYDADRLPRETTRPQDRDEPPMFNPYLFAPQPDALYRNRGDGTFEDVTARAGLADVAPGKGMGVVFADLNADGRPDIYVVNDVSQNVLWYNRGDGTFANRGAVAGIDDPRSGMGVTIGDYDNDGDFDVFSTHWQDEANVLYANMPELAAKDDTFPCYFEDVSTVVGLVRPSVGFTGWGCCFLDYDQDGWLDLFVVNGYTSPSPSARQMCIPQPAFLFRNRDGRFENQAAPLGLHVLDRYASRGAACADLDDDGDLDLVVTPNNGPTVVLENRAASGHWLKVRPRAPQPIGTVVRVEAGGRVLSRMVLAGDSFLSCGPTDVHFGLGQAARADRVTVRWPDGRITTLDAVAADRMIVVTPEGGSRR